MYFSNDAISKSWLIGHSYGANLMGAIGAFLNVKVEKIIGIDPAKTFYADSQTIGKCPQITQYIANCVIVIHSDPGTFSSRDIKTPCNDTTNPCVVDIQLKNGDYYCMDKCMTRPQIVNEPPECSPVCNHNFSSNVFFVQWTNGQLFYAENTKTNLSLYMCPPSNSYIVQQSDNPSLA